ncbi:hypothetical protein M0N77_09905 [Psychrobacter sp. AH5]
MVVISIIGILVYWHLLLFLAIIYLQLGLKIMLV